MLNVLHHIHCLGAQPLKSRGVVTQVTRSQRRCLYETEGYATVSCGQES